MKVLHPDIQEFIGQIKTLGAVGCIRVPKDGLNELIEMFGKSDVIIGPNPHPGSPRR